MSFGASDVWRTYGIVWQDAWLIQELIGTRKISSIPDPLEFTSLLLNNLVDNYIERLCVLVNTTSILRLALLLTINHWLSTLSILRCCQQMESSSTTLLDAVRTMRVRISWNGAKAQIHKYPGSWALWVSRAYCWAGQQQHAPRALPWACHCPPSITMRNWDRKKYFSLIVAEQDYFDNVVLRI